MGAIRDDPELRARADVSMAEIVAVAVAAAEGITLDNGLAAGDGFIRNSAWDLEPSLLLDLKAGRQLEVEWLSGEILRLGRKHEIPTPVHQTIWAALKPLYGGNGLRASTPRHHSSSNSL